MGNVDFIRGLYDSFAKGDVQAVLGALDPKVEWTEAEGFLFDIGKPFVGPDEVLQGVFARIEQELDGFTATPSNFIDGGETVVVEGRYRGAVKATGQKFDAQFAHLFELRDGKIVRLQEYTDTGQFQKAAGA